MVPGDTDDIKKEYQLLLNELEQFNPEMLQKHRVLAVTKCDLLDDLSRTALPDDEEVPAILKKTALRTWSVVIDLPDTYDIYCITNAERKSVMTPTFYSGYRIYVEKDPGYAVPDDARLRADISMRKNQEVVMAEIGRLRAKFGCVLPHGECWDEPRKPAVSASRPVNAKPGQPLTTANKEEKK